MSSNTSLTAPNDRDESQGYVPKNKDPLTNEQLVDAMNDNFVDSFVKNYPATEKSFADPTIPDQKFCLVSFVPSVTATPDKDGIYGMIKVRGSYSSADECAERAEHLIKTVDSYHKIYTAYVGKPFPATSSSTYSAQTAEVDIKKNITKVLSEDIKKQKKEEQQEINDIKEREKALIEESQREEEDPYERYITLRVKKAQLMWTYIETQKKMDEMKNSIIKARQEISEADEEHPDFIESYKEKYMKARQEAGIPQDDNSFMQFLGDTDEPDLGF